MVGSREGDDELACMLVGADNLEMGIGEDTLYYSTHGFKKIKQFHKTNKQTKQNINKYASPSILFRTTAKSSISSLVQDITHQKVQSEINCPLNKMSFINKCVKIPPSAWKLVVE